MFRLASFVWIMAAPVFAGVFVLTVLTVPELATQDSTLILPAAVTGAIAALPISYVIAKKLYAL